MSESVQENLVTIIQNPSESDYRNEQLRKLNDKIIYLDTYIPEPGVFFYFDNGEMVEVLPSEEDNSSLTTRRYSAKNWPVDYDNMSTTNWKWEARHMQVEGEESTVANRTFANTIDYLEAVSDY